MMSGLRIAHTILFALLVTGCNGQPDDSPTEANKELARQFFQSIDSSGGSLDFVDAWLTDDFQSRLNSPEPMDKEGYRQFMAGALVGFPNMRHEIHYMVAEDDLVALGITLHMEHTGEFAGIAPTGRSVAVEEIVVVRFRNDKIAEEWGVFDLAGLLQQLEAPAAAE